MSGYELYRMVRWKKKPTLPYLQKYFFSTSLFSEEKKNSFELRPCRLFQLEMDYFTAQKAQELKNEFIMEKFIDP